MSHLRKKFIKLLILCTEVIGISMASFNVTASPFQADSSRYDTPQIHAFNVAEVRRIAPGVELSFGLYGTPGGQATLRIAGASRNLQLIEVEAGEYEGTYIVSGRDNIAARSSVTANLRVGRQVTSEVLNESLQIGIGNHPPTPSRNSPPSISRFYVDAVDDLTAGNVLGFVLLGSPGGHVELTIAGVSGKLLLPEVRTGEYALNYAIRSRDRITARSETIAYLYHGQSMTKQALNMSLLERSTVSQRPPVCFNCGQIEAINVIETRGEGAYLGTIGGGVVGALLGSQVGKGNGRTAAQIAGAIGGAYVGRNIEGSQRKNVHFEVIVRLQNAAVQTLSFANDPGLHVGDRVKIDNGRLIRLP